MVAGLIVPGSDIVLEGVMLNALSAWDIIHACTKNSDYEIFLLDPATGRALVRGGKYLVVPTEATVSGSTSPTRASPLAEFRKEGAPERADASVRR